MSIKDNKRLVIFDNYDEIELNHDIRAYLSDSTKEISIPRLMIKWKKDLIKEYVAMIYSCGFTGNKFNNSHKRLMIRSNFSFWWMTLLSEKSPIRSKSIYKILQFRVIERLFYEKKCTHIALYSDDKKLHNLLLEWSKISGFNYERKKKKSKKLKNIDIQDLYNKLPHFIRASILLFRFVLSKRHFVGRSKKMQIDTFEDNNLPKRFIVSPFPSINEKKALAGVFQSNYWGEVQRYIDSDVNVNFLLMFTPGFDCKNAKEAIKKRDILQKKSHGRRNYYFLEEWLSYSVLFKIVIDYLFLYRKSFNQSSIKQNTYIDESIISYWRGIKPEWLSSTRGVVAIDGCIKLRLFEECLKSFNNPLDGFYLVENQPWERAFNYSWKSLFKAPLFGVQNAPFRPFDLRFYEDKRIYKYQHKSSLPIPDLLLTNGKYSETSILEFGYPIESITYVEAYKYSYLTDLQKNISRNNSKDLDKVLLVIVDGLAIFAREQIKMLGEALHTNVKYKLDKIIIKPHPFCDVSSLLKKHLSDINFELSNDSLESLWCEADIVYVSNMTSSGIESLIMGLPTIIYLDHNVINLSPALECKDVMFASSSQDFINYLEFPIIPEPRNDYLYLDESLTRWKELLASNYHYSKRSKYPYMTSFR